jgi:hypothetical protein
MKTPSPDLQQKRPSRRRGLLAGEIARNANVSVYKAKRALEVIKHAPELVPHVISGELKLAECIRAIRGTQKDDSEPELTFEEEVERSFKRWLAKWPKQDHKEILAIITML